MADSPAAAGIADNLARVRAEIQGAAQAADRDPRDITIIAVSKTHGADAVEHAVAAGQTVFGENRVQEAAAKYPLLRARHAGLELHLIGPLQTNKVRGALSLFDAIHSLDRSRLAATIANEIARMREAGSDRAPGIFVQVNTGEEPQKAGVLPADADAFIDECRSVHGLTIAGLMCIPPADEDAAPHFALLREMARRNGLDKLSMGMSADFELAVQFGATHVRIGTSIFGPRPVAPRG